MFISKVTRTGILFARQTTALSKAKFRQSPLSGYNSCVARLYRVFGQSWNLPKLHVEFAILCLKIVEPSVENIEW